MTTTDLSTVAADEAAIQSDLPKIPSPMIPRRSSVAGPGWDHARRRLSWRLRVRARPAVASPILPIVPIGPVLPQPIIISPFGGLSLLGSLSSVGVVTSPVFVATEDRRSGAGFRPAVDQRSADAERSRGGDRSCLTSRRLHRAPWQQLQADVQKLQTELQSLAEKSGLTIADHQSLTNDAQAIARPASFSM